MQLSVVRGPCSRWHGGGKGARTPTHCCRRHQSRRPGHVQRLPPAMKHDCQWQAPGVESFTTGRLQRPVWWWRYRCLTCRADVHLPYRHTRCCIPIAGLVSRKERARSHLQMSVAAASLPSRRYLNSQDSAGLSRCTDKSKGRAVCSLTQDGGHFGWAVLLVGIIPVGITVIRSSGHALHTYVHSFVTL